MLLDLKRCDTIFSCNSVTYVNTALNCCSQLDYFLSSDPSSLLSFDVFDDGSNISDHLPILLRFNCDVKPSCNKTTASTCPTQSFLRWDHGDRNSYYAITGQKLRDILSSSPAVLSSVQDNVISRDIAISQIELIYSQIVNILLEAAAITIPTRRKNFYKFWWNEELDILKEQSMASHYQWVNAGRPRSGPIACDARSCKLRYKQRIAECQKQETMSYTNDLHDALLQKEGPSFWRSWRAKFDYNSRKVTQVNGCTDDQDILTKFEAYFSQCWSPNSESGSNTLHGEYLARKPNYCGTPITVDLLIDVEAVDGAINSLKCGKAAGLDGVTAEHIIYCHPALCSLLYRLFNAMICYHYVRLHLNSVILCHFLKIIVLFTRNLYRLMIFVVFLLAAFFRKYLKNVFYIVMIAFLSRPTISSDSREI